MNHNFEIPKAALTEISGTAGNGKTEVVLQFLAEDSARNSRGRIAWIEEEFTVYPCAFLQNRVELGRVLFIEAGREAGRDPSPRVRKSKAAKPALWAALQILRSQIFGVVVLNVDFDSETDLRRLQLAAEKSQTSVILLTETATREGTWPISVQLEVSRSLEDGSPQLTPIKYRGQRLWKLG